MSILDRRNATMNGELRGRQRGLEKRMELCHIRLGKLRETDEETDAITYSVTKKRMKRAIEREQEVLNGLLVKWLDIDEEIDGVKE